MNISDLPATIGEIFPSYILANLCFSTCKNSCTEAIASDISKLDMHVADILVADILIADLLAVTTLAAASISFLFYIRTCFCFSACKNRISDHETGNVGIVDVG